MKKSATCIAAVVAALCSLPQALAHEGASTGPARKPPEQLGKVSFPTSCAPQVAGRFERAMALLHSFWANDAIKEFNAVLQQDPACAIAYWGIAMAHQQNPLTGLQPNPKAAAEALAGLEKARTIGAKTQRERDYLAAIELIYKDADTVVFPSRRLAYEKAMEALAQRYPDDPEAATFHALALQMTALLTDKTYANQLKSAAILERLVKDQPEHPGIVHYLVHAYDYPAIANRGLSAARLYARIAPNHPHALHMPSHIYTRLGMWQDSIDANRRSAAAAGAEGNGTEQTHAMDYLVHAHLQLGQDAQAKRIVSEALAVTTINPAVFVGHYAIAAMPAREALERRAWKDAIALKPRPTRFLFPDAIIHFARGLGYARTGDVAAAKAEEHELAKIVDQLATQKNNYWSNQAEVQRLAVAAWTALAQANRDEAVKLMRAAADLEDSMEKHIVTPSAVVPARELLGDMLLELGQPGEALRAFEASAEREPNRLRGLYGSARAAALSGDRAKAKTYYAKLISQTAKSDGSRPELQQAKAYLAQR
jgi:tetratricopeptide (TPR) repeat protein